MSEIQTDRAIANIVFKTAPIDESDGSEIVHSTTNGTRFVCTHIFIQSEGETDVQILSGSTALTGNISMAANDILELFNDGFGVLYGDATGEDLIVTTSPSTQLNGFAVVGEL